MLQISVPGREGWDESKNEFIYPAPQILQLEHSLISLSKWEAKWKKAFLSKRDKTTEETLDYVRCMSLNQHVDPDVYNRLTSENIEQINQYISAPMTATCFPEDGSSSKSKETVTSELIYYWMIVNSIPFECQKWHLNRLLTLIKVCSVKNTPPKKRSQQEIMAEYAALNARRKKEWHTTG